MDLTVTVRGVTVNPEAHDRISVELDTVNITEILEDIGAEDVLSELDDDAIKEYAIKNLGLVEEEN